MRLLASSLLSLSLLACSDGTSPPPPGTQPDATPILVDAPPPTSGAVLDLVPSDHAFIRTLDAGRQLWQLDDGVYWQDELRAAGTVLRGQLDGDLAIATQRYNTQTATPPTYCRFDTRTGELDQTFGAYGCAEAPRSYFTTTGIVKGGDGYLALVQRQCTNGCPDVERSFGLVRFSAAGVVDLTFGTEGIQFSTVLADLDAEYFAAQSTGKLVVSGYTGLYAMKLFRIDATGELDTTFGTDGFIPMANGGQVRVLADDSILMESTYNGTERIDRYTANGQVLWRRTSRRSRRACSTTTSTSSARTSMPPGASSSRIAAATSKTARTAMASCA